MWKSISSKDLWLFECQKCGALCADTGTRKHERWHETDANFNDGVRKLLKILSNRNKESDNAVERYLREQRIRRR